MLISVSGLESGGRLAVEFFLDTNVPEGFGVTGRAACVHLSGCLSNDGGLFRFEGQGSTELSMECARCLKPLSVSLSFNVEAFFAGDKYLAMEPPRRRETDNGANHDTDTDAPNPGGMEIAAITDGCINLEPAVRTGLFVCIPMRALCREECRGLCVYCGQDLNIAECGCRPEPDERFAGLKALFESGQSDDSGA